MESVSVKHEDGTIDSFQRAHVGSELEPAQLEQLYWDEIRRATWGATRFSRGAIRARSVARDRPGLRPQQNAARGRG